MIFLSEDAFKCMKREYITNYIIMFVGFTFLYAISKKVNKQEKKYNDLTKKIKELNSKGD